MSSPREDTRRTPIRSRRTTSLPTILLASELLLGCLAVLHFLWFLRVIVREDTPPKPLAAAIVFTGDHERVRAGLKLSESKQARRLFISGANPNAGIWLERFAQQFGEGRAGFEDLLKCCVVFGVKANTTLQNGIESSCWLSANNISGPIGLVTSSSHMPRSMYALAYFAPDYRIFAIPVSDESNELSLSLIVTEYLQYVATQIVLLAPRQLTRNLLGDFADGCEPSG